MQDLKFWYAPGACSLATHIALHETGLAFTPIKATVPNINNPQDPAYLPEEFLSINPKRRVPVLAINDEIITEAPAILLAISTLAPELHLYGSTSIERIRIDEWLNWISGTLHGQGFGALFRPQRFTEDKSLHPELKRQGYATVTRLFGEIDKKLQGKAFALGDTFTVVDAFLFPFWRWGNLSGIKMAADYPDYTALVTKVRERKSAQAALQTEKLAPAEFGSAESSL